MRKHFLAGLLCVLTASAAMLTASGCARNEVELDDEQIVNFTMPEQGEDIVVLTIKDYGDVKIRLFPEETAKGAENFKLLAQSGFYDELIFHRVISGFMIQGGDPKGTGTGGVDAWGSESGFAQTISNKLCHFPGAVAYAIAADKLNKSQFYIVTGDAVTEEAMNYYKSYGYAFSDAVEKMYYAYGGTPHLDGGYEIFGQVFDGLDLILQIQNVQTDANDKPTTPVVIEKAQVVPYEGSAPNWLTYAGEPIQVQ